MFGLDHAYFTAWSLLFAYLAIMWTNALSISYVGRYVFHHDDSNSLHYTIWGQEVCALDIILPIMLIVLASFILLRGYKVALRVISLLAMLVLLCIIVLFIGVVSASDPNTLFSPAFSTTLRTPHFAQIVQVVMMGPLNIYGL